LTKVEKFANKKVEKSCIFGRKIVQKRDSIQKNGFSVICMETKRK
jgi:hypothetical protein